MDILIEILQYCFYILIGCCFACLIRPGEVNLSQTEW